MFESHFTITVGANKTQYPHIEPTPPLQCTTQIWVYSRVEYTQIGYGQIGYAQGLGILKFGYAHIWVYSRLGILKFGCTQGLGILGGGYARWGYTRWGYTHFWVCSERVHSVGIHSVGGPPLHPLLGRTAKNMTYSARVGPVRFCTMHML